MDYYFILFRDLGECCERPIWTFSVGINRLNMVERKEGKISACRNHPRNRAECKNFSRAVSDIFCGTAALESSVLGDNDFAAGKVHVLFQVAFPERVRQDETLRFLGLPGVTDTPPESARQIEVRRHDELNNSNWSDTFLLGPDGKLDLAIPPPGPNSRFTYSGGRLWITLCGAGSAPGAVGLLQVNARVPAGFIPTGPVAAELAVGSAVAPGLTIWLK